MRGWRGFSGWQLLTFMIGIGSSPGLPKSSIMFLMSIERSATLRSMKELVRWGCEGGGWWVVGVTTYHIRSRHYRS